MLTLTMSLQVMVILQILVPGLHSLPTAQDYEIVIPQRIHAVHRRDTEEKYPYVAKYKLHIEGKPLVLHLQKNEHLIADNYKETSYSHHDDTPRMRSLKENIKDHCHYQGYVEKDKQSLASISTCSGISGFFHTKDRRFIIEPHNLTKGEHIVYEKEEQAKSCAVTSDHELAGEVLTAVNETKEEIDNLLNSTKYIELYMVADNSIFQKYHQNATEVKNRIYEMVNYMNLEFKEINVLVALTGFEIWNTKDQINVSATVEDTLKRFSKWRQETLLPRMAHDSAVLITNTDFDGITVGLAYVSTMCTNEHSAGVIQDRTGSAVSVGATLAHEVGHTLGLSHDNNDLCSCPSKSCIMTSRITSILPDRFSNCSLTQLRTFFMNKMPKCLLNKPYKDKIFSPPMCGNNFVEEGEECDCGTVQDCTNLCCNASTCKLKPGAVCADGECCENCQFKKAGDICRHSHNDCDLPDICDGNSSRCLNIFQKDGTSCMNGQGYCLNGKCPTLTNQCTALWGPGALVSIDGCFILNTRGLYYGYCSKLGDTFQPCPAPDVKCGVLFCSGGNPYPYGSFKTIQLSVCRAIIHPSGMVETGIKCANEKVCYKGVCTPKEAVYKTCFAECPGRQTCDQKGQCYCDEGAPPDSKCAMPVL